MSCPINGLTYKKLKRPSRYTRRLNRDARRYGYVSHKDIKAAAKAWHSHIVAQRVMRGAARGG